MTWPVVKIRDVAKAHYGKALKKEFRDDSGSFDVFGSSGHVGVHTEALITYSTLIIGRKGSVGEVIWAPKGGWVIDTAYYLELLDKDIVDLRYLYYALKKANLAQRTITTSIPGLNRDDFYDSEIPLPPLAEQKRIAAILDKADAIRRKRQQAIQLADDFLRAVFLDMFGDPVTNPKGWETEKLGNISRIRRGASPRPISDFLGGDVPWIKIGDGSKGDQVYLHSTKEFVTQKGADKSRYLEAGALVFANCGVSLGFARILKISGCIHDGWLAIDELDSRINKVFLLKWINQLTLYFRSIAPDGTQPNLNTEIMKNQDVILPPIEEQKRYEVVLHKNERLLNQLRFSLTEIENNFESLSQKAFRGEL